MLSVEDALKEILACVKKAGVERIPFFNGSGRVIAEDIISGISIPPFNNSAMDGYALQHADITGAAKDAPKRLTVIEDVPAGYLPQKRVESGKAIRIMTGAKMPEGADTVVMQEDSEKEGDDVLIYREVKKGENIRLSGEDVLKGEIVIKGGTKLRAQEIGLLASMGVSWITVYQSPRVAILATGDEITEPGNPLKDGEIYTSNSFTLFNQVLELGGTPQLLGIAKDNEEDLRIKLTQTTNSDIILTSGGISTGDYDFVKKVLTGLGFSIEFWKVAMKPGKPFAFGRLGNKLFFGIPGNPVSSMIAFEQFVRPAMLKMTGQKNIYRQMFYAELLEDIKKKPGRIHFARAQVTYKNGKFYASLTGEQGSGMLKSMVLANALLVIESDKSYLKKGDYAGFQLLSPLSSENFKEGN